MPAALWSHPPGYNIPGHNHDRTVIALEHHNTIKEMIGYTAHRKQTDKKEKDTTWICRNVAV